MVERDTAEAKADGPSTAEDTEPVPPVTESNPQPQPAEAQPAASSSTNGPGSGNDTNASAGAWFRANWVPLLLLVLSALTVSGIIVGLTAKQDDAFGKFCIIAAVPLLSIAIGFFGNRFFSDLSARETLRKDVQMAAYTTYHLQSSVVYVDERVGYALAHLLQGSIDNALLNLVSAKTATELSFGVAQQSASQLEMISPAGATAAKDIFAANSADARPKIIPGDSPEVANPGGDDDGAK